MAKNTRRVLTAIYGMVLLLAAVPARAEMQVACWFYKYQWVYYRMVPNTAPPTTFPTSGTGNGLWVTDGEPPSADESELILNEIRRTLPRGDAAAPPPQAYMQNINRMACPASLDGMSLDLARVWLRQPSVPSAATGGAAPRR